MNYHFWYAGRVVLDTDLNEVSDWILEALENAAYDASLTQDDVSLSPEAFGGIVRGLGVTLFGPATDLKVRVALGMCYDEAGQRAALTSLATITLSHTGELAVGVVTGAATIAPVAVAPAMGQEVWISLYLKYAEIASNPKTDLTGAPVNFDADESFQFEIRTGAPGAPPVSSRDALGNSRVLLADILIENPAGVLQIKANGVCETNDDMDILGYGLDDAAALEGRRSDYIACENPTDFEAWRDGGAAVEQRMSLRGNPREALYNLCMALARQTAVVGPPRQPVGAELIGRAADTGAATSNRVHGAKTVALGTLDTQMAALLDILTDALMRGGGNILQPQAGLDGVLCSPASMDAEKYFLKFNSLTGGGGGAAHRMLGTAYGHKHSPHDFLDDFMIIGGGANAYPTQPGADDSRLPWHAVTNDDGALTLINEPGGVVRLGTGATTLANDYLAISTGMNAGTQMRWWNCGAAPWAIFQVRFRILTTIADTRIRIGLWSDDPVTHGASAVYLEFDFSAHITQLSLRAMSGGVPGVAVALLDPLLADTWYTVNVAMEDNQHVAGQLNSGGTWVSADAGAPVANGGYTLGAQVYTFTGAEKFLDIDQIGASDGIAIADMLA